MGGKMNQTNLGYKGIVTLTFKSKSGKTLSSIQYNEALPLLSKVFAQALLGYDVTGSIPTFLDLCTEDDNGDLFSLLTSPIILTGKNYSVDNDNFYYVSVNAIITSSFLQAYSPESTHQCYLILQDINNNNLCKLKLKDSEGTNITAGSDGNLNNYIGNGKNLVINWKLKLCNSNEEIVS